MKLKDSFTPGPWHANIAADSLRVPDGVCSADGLHVCDVASYGASPSTRHANARLVASAPELAEALAKIAAGSIKDCGPNKLGTVNLDAQTMQAIARATLAKAGLL